MSHALVRAEGVTADGHGMKQAFQAELCLKFKRMCRCLPKIKVKTDVWPGR